MTPAEVQLNVLLQRTSSNDTLWCRARVEWWASGFHGPCPDPSPNLVGSNLLINHEGLPVLSLKACP